MTLHTIGIDLGGTKILAAAIDGEGRVLVQEKLSTKAEHGPKEVLKRIVRCIELVVEALPDGAMAIGVGSPGMLDLETGTVVFSPNLPGWENIPLVRHLRAHFAVPVVLENDVSAGTLGEYVYGAGRHLGPDGLLVALFIGTGIGGGLVLNGTIWQGLRGIAGEIGHMVIDRDSPASCGCGRRGCLEALASRTAIERRIRARLNRGERSPIKADVKQDRPIKSRLLAEAFLKKDNLVKQEVVQAGRALGVGIANIINILDPHLVVLGGGVMEALGEPLLPVIRKVVEDYILPHPQAHAQLVLGELGDLAGAVGAAILAREC